MSWFIIACISRNPKTAASGNLMQATEVSVIGFCQIDEFVQTANKTRSVTYSSMSLYNQSVCMTPFFVQVRYHGIKKYYNFSYLYSKHFSYGIFWSEFPCNCLVWSTLTQKNLFISLFHISLLRPWFTTYDLCDNMND